MLRRIKSFSCVNERKKMFSNSFIVKISAFCCICLLIIMLYVKDIWPPTLNFDPHIAQTGTNFTSTMVFMINSTSTKRPMVINKTLTASATSTTTTNASRSSVNVNFYQHRQRKIGKTCKILICPIGNLGNQIWEYMSLFAVWKLINRSNYIPYIHEKMARNLKVLFPKLSISVRNSICNNSMKQVIKRSKPLDDYKIWFTTRFCRDVFLEEYSCRYDEIIKYGVDKIRTEMRFDEDLIRDSQIALHNFKAILGLENETVTYVGMHYRGTDYVNHLAINYGNYNPQIPDYHYYINAMDYFKKKYENVIFILITIDKEWLDGNSKFIQRNGNVLVNPYNKDDRNHDLVLLSNCNHSIINYGSFGVTGALFNGGETFVYDLKLPLDHRGSTLAMGIANILNWHLLT